MRSDILNDNIGGGIKVVKHQCAASATQTVDLADANPEGVAMAQHYGTNTSDRTIDKAVCGSGVITVTLSGAASAGDDLAVVYFGDDCTTSTDE